MNISALKPNSIRQLVKPVWKNFSETDARKVFETLPIQNNCLGRLSLGIRDYKDGFNRMIIEIKNSLGKVFGKEIISIDTHNKYMTGYNILVEPEFRQKHFRFGELLRLASIMEIVENKSPYIYIYSKDTAVYFHSKYKFVPNIKTFEERNSSLETILRDKSPEIKDLVEKAKDITRQIALNKNNSDIQRECVQKVNILISEYIERAMQKKDPQINHPFKKGIEMRLYRDTILKNKEYFNTLFENHGIDYKI